MQVLMTSGESKLVVADGNILGVNPFGLLVGPTVEAIIEAALYDAGSMGEHVYQQEQNRKLAERKAYLRANNYFIDGYRS